VGVGLLYRYGYFHQLLDDTGYQREQYDRSDPRSLPLRPVLIGDRVPLRIPIPFPGRHVYARAWRAAVGRIPLYLLDTDVPENNPEDRWITAHLYGGDQDTRIRQELVLGIGGARLLRALRIAGVESGISRYHLNEGHSAFVVLELARERLALGAARNIEEALLQVAPRVAFTTHTPVTAGHDTFPSRLIEEYLSAYRKEVGLTHEDVMRLGRVHPNRESEAFNMTVLALRGASRRNAVSRLHGQVSRQMWAGVGIGSLDADPRVRMGSITNGVHLPTWAGPEMAALFDRVLGCAWRTAAREPSTWTALDRVPAATLWRARTAQRQRLLAHAGLELDAERTLVLGFARRFATYKRAGLLLAEAHRLADLLTSRCVAIVFAGKAHPRDEPGKLLVQRVVEASRDRRFQGRLVFLADYDLELARLLVQGSDVWLNTPRRPMEASGTSGMKAVLNGALHVSELDGWWDEAYHPAIGWALGAGLPDELSEQARDAAESRQLMDLLEQQIAPLFFGRDASGLPAAWLAHVSRSIATLAPRYSAERMVAEYATRVYWPSASARPRAPETNAAVGTSSPLASPRPAAAPNRVTGGRA
jgi:glycogen phosphorylase